MNIGFGIAIGSMAIGAALLEIYDKPVGGLWFLVVMAVVFADWD